MAQYTKVLADEFNNIRSTVANVLGTGAGTRGYGSPITSSAVSVGQKIKPTEFTALKTDVNACYNHITGGNASLNSIVAGNKISWANIVTYQVAATYIDANRDSSIAVNKTVQDIVTFYKGWGTGATFYGGAYSELFASGTVTWSSAEAMRYFFNQGGYLYLYGSASGGTSPNKTKTFVDLTNSIGFTLTRSEYRAGSGNSQSVATSVAPYSGGTPSSVSASLSAPSSNTISWAISTNDTGDEDGDADGIVVKSTIDTNLTFYVEARLPTGTGITDYSPTIATTSEPFRVS
jgi:hypothetical protein